MGGLGQVMVVGEGQVERQRKQVVSFEVQLMFRIERVQRRVLSFYLVGGICKDCFVLNGFIRIVYQLLNIFGLGGKQLLFWIFLLFKWFILVQEGIFRILFQYCCLCLLCLICVWIFKDFVYYCGIFFFYDVLV